MINWGGGGVELGMEGWVGKGGGEGTRIREEEEKNSTSDPSGQGIILIVYLVSIT